MAIKRNIVMIGNPGVGKSALLNSLIGRTPVAFSFGRTSVLDKFEDDVTGIRYIDTPGLEDVLHRTKTANAIKDELSQGGEFQIFFVITLEGGRLKPSDIATMNLFLEAAPEIRNNYSIIINKLPPRIITHLTTNAEANATVMASLKQYVSGISYIYFNRRDPELEDEDDMIAKLDPTLLSFISNSVSVHTKVDAKHSESSTPISRDIATAPMSRNIVMIGNPGSGKSTLLNCLIGKTPVAFSSGVSFGKGRTVDLQKYIDSVTGIKFMDTPGLSDVALRKDAAHAIKTALKKGGEFQIFFVITLESGRVKPDDITTMKLVLEAAPDIGNNYSVIINKIPTPTLNRLNENLEDRLALMACLNRDLPGTSYIYFCEKKQALEDAEDKIIPLDSPLVSFINNSMKVTIKTVHDIETEKFMAVTEKLGAQIEQLMRDNALLRQTMVEKEKQYQELMKMQQQKLEQQIQQQQESERKWMAAHNKTQKEFEAERNKSPSLLKATGDLVLAAALPWKWFG